MITAFGCLSSKFPDKYAITPGSLGDSSRNGQEWNIFGYLATADTSSHREMGQTSRKDAKEQRTQSGESALRSLPTWRLCVRFLPQSQSQVAQCPDLLRLSAPLSAADQRDQLLGG